MEQLKSDIESVNIWLKENYGQTVEGHSIFRILWTTGVTEKVFDTFRDFYGPMFLREKTEVREVLKYPFMQERFVLEKIELLPENAEVKISDSKSSKFSYECIYAFQDKKGNFLPLNRDVIEIILYFYLNKIRSSQQNIDDDMKEKDKKEREYYIQKIGENQQIPHLMDLVY